MYKQIIIARKDLNMSPGKLAAQVSHGSMAFLTNIIKNHNFTRPVAQLITQPWDADLADFDKIIGYRFNYFFDKEINEQWIDGKFTKCILQAKNKNHLLKAKTMAEELGMKEGEDFWLIYDNCHIELKPEDERTLTVIGFKPMDSEYIDQIGRKYHLYM